MDKCFKCKYGKANYLIIKDGTTQRYCLSCIRIIKRTQEYQAS